MRFDSSVGIGKTCSDKSMHGTLYLFECGLELDIPVFYPMKMLLLNHVNTNLKLPVLNSPYIWFDSNNTYEKILDIFLFWVLVNISSLLY